MVSRSCDHQTDVDKVFEQHRRHICSVGDPAMNCDSKDLIKSRKRLVVHHAGIQESCQDVELKQAQLRDAKGIPCSSDGTALLGTASDTGAADVSKVPQHDRLSFWAQGSVVATCLRQQSLKKRDVSETKTTGDHWHW